MNWKDAWGWRDCFSVSPPMEGEIVGTFICDDPIDIPGETVTDTPIPKEVRDRALKEVDRTFREVFGDDEVDRLEG